jgi:trigger factor
MNVTVTPAPRSSVRLQVEEPPERLERAIADAVRALSRRTRVPGFRPGKAPRAILERHLGPGAVLEEAVDHLVERSYREALIESEVLPIARPEVEIVQAEEGKPFIYAATVAVRPEVTLGDYRGFNFEPEIETIDDTKVDRVIEELRDQYAQLVPVEDRAAQDGDYGVIGYAVTRDGEAVAGGSAERMPLIVGEERFIPGFVEQVNGLRPGESREFDLPFPDDYPEESLAGAQAHFSIELRELREKVPPAADDDFAGSLGDYEDMAALRTAIRARLERNALDRARHGFADRIIEYAVANAGLELPDPLVEQEVEIMHDEFRASLARQGITEEAYLKVVGKTSDDLHAEWRPAGEKRAKTLLVISKIAEVEGIVVPEADVDAEIARARVAYAGDDRLIGYLESERGRSFIRSSLRRSRTVEKLVDDWLADHPDHPPIPHAEDDASATLAAEAASAAAVDAGTLDADLTETRDDTVAIDEPAATAAS